MPTHTIRRCIALAAGLFVAGLLPVAAHAVSIDNQDSEAHTLIVTEDGMRFELVVSAGETVSFCPSGCFLILPNGDRAALAGSESLAIVAGEVVVNF